MSDAKAEGLQCALRQNVDEFWRGPNLFGCGLGGNRSGRLNIRYLSMSVPAEAPKRPKETLLEKKKKKRK